jgi:hypothetical protein
MKKIESRLISLLTRKCAGYLTPSEIKKFVLKKYHLLSENESKAEPIASDLIRVKANLIILGWVDGIKMSVNYKHKKPSQKVDEWVNSLEHGKVINQGIIAVGTGVYLEMLDESGEELKSFSKNALESLLRHVEVKRKKSLDSFSQSLSYKEKILEGLAISILFCRTARRHADIRFLNTALKMNDWVFPMVKNEVSGNPLILYLVALTEQEISVMELLQC